MKLRNSFLIVFVAILYSCSNNNSDMVVESPNGLYKINFYSSGEEIKMGYTVNFQDREIVSRSPLGLLLQEENGVIGNQVKIVKIENNEVRGEWTPPYGTYSKYPENYNEKIFSLSHEALPNLNVKMIFRAYDEGVAFKYYIENGNRETHIKKELTGFALAPDAMAWVTQMSQGVISKISVQDIQEPSERPLLVELTDSLYVALGEAAQIDYSRMKFISSTVPGLVKVNLEGVVKSNVPFYTPWRYIMAGNSAGEILEHNYLILNLNEPSAIKNTDWIKPGKVMRDMTLTTHGAKTYIDFAVKHNLQYIIESAGWYGNEYSETEDATTPIVDPARSKGPLDMHEIIRYGKGKGIDIMVYVNRNQLEKQLDEILPLYQDWGIKGIKYGFVRTGDQYWTSWMHEAVRKAADHKMVLSIHDDYRPVGYSRTYPNLMTMEGIRGDEESPDNHHTLMTMFTRMIAGAGDHTICYFAPRVNKVSSHATQLAKAVCIYSPLLWLYWYDRPQGASVGFIEDWVADFIITEVPELEFFDNVPTTWDETRVIHSEVGELGTIARRSGTDWFIGTINGKEDNNVEIKLDFLESGKEYEAAVYYDDPDVPTVTRVGIERLSVNNRSVINRIILGNNGMAIHIYPK